MPPTTRKPAKKPTRRAAKPVADNTVDAEATGFGLPFSWSGIDLVIDLTQMEFGRGTYALRRVGNDNLTLVERVNAMIDVLEAALGEEQLAKVVEKTPRIFDDTATMMAFWEAFNAVCHGATSGESSAS